MKTFLKTAFLSAISLILLSANAPLALASMPYLTATTSGGGNVQLTINSADAYSRIDLSYRPQGTSLWTQISNVGYTDQSGYFNQTVNIGYTGSQIDMYVIVNGQQSPTVSVNGSGGGCNVYPYNCSGSLSLSQSNVNLNAGQSSMVSVYGNYNNSIYISNNTNSSVATATVSGNSINVYGNSNGSTTMTVCSYSNSAFCATLYVTVNGSGCNQYNCGTITFSPTSVNLSTGQSTTVSVYSSGGYSLYISSNSNSNVVTATLSNSGNTLSLYGQNSGSATITVCNSGYAPGCGTLYVTVGGGCTYNNCNGQISFSQNNVNLNSSQSTTVQIYGGNYGSYYISGNSNSNVVSASISGSTINLYGYSSGSSTITVCGGSYSNQCAYLSVTVNGNTGNGQIYFTPANPTVNVGQTTNVSINTYQYSGYSYYVSNNSNSNVVSANVSGNLLSLYGQSAGSASVTVCSYYGTSQCGVVYVTVSGGGIGGNNVGIYGNYFNPNNITVTAGSTLTFRNYDSMAHTVTANNGNFNSGSIYPGSTYSLTLNTPGTYTYYCQFHPGMTGTITVTGVLGASQYSNGTLINDNNTIYIIYRNTKTGFGNYSAFTGLGFKLSNVIYADTSSINSSGHVVTTANGQHPWGSWVKNGSTIYFVHEQGLIPIASYDTFINNGGNINLVVNANFTDLNLPRLSIMEPLDSRLR